MTRAWNLTRFYPGAIDEQKLDEQRVTVGKWSPLDTIGRKLESIACNIDPQSSTLAGLKSVPDPWAHPRSFADAVLDTNHPLHDICVGHWRWLLAVIGLSGTRPHIYSVEFTPLDLASDGTRASRILRDLAPRRSLWTPPGKAEIESLSDASWTRPVLVTMVAHNGQKHELGLLNPTSLISSGRRYTEIRPAVSPGWIASGLSDPTKNLSRGEKWILKHYLTALQQDLDGKLGETDKTPWGKLRSQLNAFIKDCEATGLEIEVARHAQVDQLPALYRAMLLLPREQPSSDCRIAGTSLILADPALAKSFDRNPQEFRLWGQYTLEDLVKIPRLLDEIAPLKNGTRTIPGTELEIVEPDQLLTDRLYELDGLNGDAAFGCHGPTLSGFALPVRPVAFQFIEASNVKASLKYDNGHVELAVPIKTESGVSAHPLIKKMEKVDLICREYQISIWPNFRSRNWQEYFARLSSNIDMRAADQNYLVPIDILSLESMPTQPVRAEALVRPLVRRSTRPIDAIVCAATKGGANRDQSDYAGLLLLNEPEELSSDASTGVAVAVDFGTTGTIAMAEGDINPIAFRERVIRPLGISETDRERIPWQLIDFFPIAWPDSAPIAQQMPVLSAWFESDIWTLPGEAASGMPLFLPTQRAEEVSAIVERLGKIKSNLKWSHGLRDIALAYLLRLGLMIRAELAHSGRHVERWVFTHPRSLPQSKLDWFKDVISKAFVRSLAGMEAAEPAALARAITDGIEFRVEDEACALSTFDARDAGDSTLILDIGGRTTDVTLFQRVGMDQGGFRRLWQGSLRIAGMDYFTQALTDDTDLLEWLELEKWREVLDKERNPETRPFRLELLMGGDTLETKLREAWIDRDDKRAKDHRPVKKLNDIRLEATTLTFLGGIAWYLGSIAQKLDNANADLFGKLHVRLCGRGSRFPLLIHQPAVYDRVARALGMFHKAAGITGTAVVRGGVREPKQEIVAGALINGLDRRILTGDASTRLYHVVEVAAGAMTPASAQDPLPDDTLPTLRAAAFARFLADLRAQVGIDIKVDDLAAQIAKLPERSDEVDLNEEPAFIVCLRWLIDAIASPEKNRGVRFAVVRPDNA